MTHRYQPLQMPTSIPFDPSNVEHMHAYIGLRFGTQKLYKHYRFKFDESKFGDVLSAMNDAVARHYIETLKNTELSNHMQSKENPDYVPIDPKVRPMRANDLTRHK